jgi:hypothetical protein
LIAIRSGSTIIAWKTVALSTTSASNSTSFDLTSAGISLPQGSSLTLTAAVWQGTINSTLTPGTVYTTSSTTGFATGGTQIASNNPTAFSITTGGATTVSTTATVDTSAPIAPVLSLGTGVANGATAAEAIAAGGVVTLTAESGASVAVTFTRGANTVTKTVTGNGATPVAVALAPADLTTLGDGSISVSATATDAAGNASSAGTTSFTLDTAAPSALVLSPPVDNGIIGDGITNNVPFSVSGLEAGASWQYSDDNGQSWTNGTGSTFTIYGNFSANQVQVRPIDAAGNVGPATSYGSAITVNDTSGFAPPEITITSVGGDGTVTTAAGDTVVTGSTVLAPGTKIGNFYGENQLGICEVLPTTDANGNYLFSYPLSSQNLTTLGDDGSKQILAKSGTNYSSAGYSFTLQLTCFIAGTLIRTPQGERPIEQLQPGDLVLTPEGPVPVKFLARTRRHVAALRCLGRMPIQVQAGALGALGPERTTCMSPSHAILIDGHLVEAGALLNGTTVTQLQEWPETWLTYYNIELEVHGLMGQWPAGGNLFLQLPQQRLQPQLLGQHR